MTNRYVRLVVLLGLTAAITWLVNRTHQLSQGTPMGDRPAAWFLWGCLWGLVMEDFHQRRTREERDRPKIPRPPSFGGWRNDQ